MTATATALTRRTPVSLPYPPPHRSKEITFTTSDETLCVRLEAFVKLIQEQQLNFADLVQQQQNKQLATTGSLNTKELSSLQAYTCFINRTKKEQLEAVMAIYETHINNLQQTITAMQTRIEQLEAVHPQTIEELQEEYQDAINDLKEDYRQTLLQLKRRYKGQQGALDITEEANTHSIDPSSRAQYLNQIARQQQKLDKQDQLLRAIVKLFGHMPRELVLGHWKSLVEEGQLRNRSIQSLETFLDYSCPSTSPPQQQSDTAGASSSPPTPPIDLNYCSPSAYEAPPLREFPPVTPGIGETTSQVPGNKQEVAGATTSPIYDTGT